MKETVLLIALALFAAAVWGGAFWALHLGDHYPILLLCAGSTLLVLFFAGLRRDDSDLD